jgi:hypothetical protein
LNSHASNLPAAVNDGQWHSFGNSARASAGTVGAAHVSTPLTSNLVARNASLAGGGHSLATPRTSAAFVNGSAGFHSFRFRGAGFRGGWGFRGGCCWGGGWAFGIGWPYWGFYWGPGWGYAWDPWWYGPYGYNAWPGYSYYSYPDYGDDWSDNPPPYQPDVYQDNGGGTNGNNENSRDKDNKNRDTQGNHLTTSDYTSIWSDNPPPYRLDKVAENNARAIF